MEDQSLSASPQGYRRRKRLSIPQHGVGDVRLLLRETGRQMSVKYQSVMAERLHRDRWLNSWVDDEEPQP